MAGMVQIGIFFQTSWSPKGVQGLKEGEGVLSLAMFYPLIETLGRSWEMVYDT